MRLGRLRISVWAFVAVLLCGVFAACGANDEKQPVRKIADLDRATIGVQLGTTSDGLATKLEEKGKGAKVERFNKVADAVQTLKQGKVDCVVTDEAPAKAFQRMNPSLRILPENLKGTEFAICVSKGNSSLRNAINEALFRLKGNGTIDSIVSRHIDQQMSVAYTPSKSGRRDRSDLGLEDGMLRFATNAAFEPFEYHKDGQIVGIDVDIAHAIGDELGVDVEIQDIEFDAIIASVQSGKADAGIAGMSVTPEREKNINFTDPYTTVHEVILVNNEEVENDCGLGIVDKFKVCFIDGARYQYLLKGLGNTLVITIFAIILSVILGTVIAIIRSTHDKTGRLRFPDMVCQLYLTIVRGTPTMVQLLVIYYVVFASVDVNKIVVAVIAFGLNSAAYIAEVVRSGIMSVDNGQMEAGRSLGLSYSKTMRLVILPQAFKNVLPAMGNELITLLKETSISGYIGLVDLTKGSDIIRSVTYDAMLPLGMVACIYLVIVLALSAGVHRLEKQLRK